MSLGYCGNTVTAYNNGFWVSEATRQFQAAGGAYARLEVSEFMLQNGVTALGEDFAAIYASDFIKNHAFAGSKMNFTLPDGQDLEVDEATFGAAADAYLKPNTEIAVCACSTMLENLAEALPADLKDNIL